MVSAGARAALAVSLGDTCFNILWVGTGVLLAVCAFKRRDGLQVPPHGRQRVLLARDYARQELHMRGLLLQQREPREEKWGKEMCCFQSGETWLLCFPIL